MRKNNKAELLAPGKVEQYDEASFYVHGYAIHLSQRLGRLMFLEGIRNELGSGKGASVLFDNYTSETTKGRTEETKS